MGTVPDTVTSASAGVSTPKWGERGRLSTEATSLGARILFSVRLKEEEGMSERDN